MSKVLCHAWLLSLLLSPVVADIGEWKIPPQRLEDEDDEHWPIAVDVQGLVMKSNIIFTTDGGENVTLDLYRPAKHDAEPLPCVIAIHGGGWRVNTEVRGTCTIPETVARKPPTSSLVRRPEVWRLSLEGERHSAFFDLA